MIWRDFKSNINRSFQSFVDYNVQDSKNVKGSAQIAINEWLSQFNVRTVQIEAPAGMETKITVTPAYRSASPNIKVLRPKDRQCQFLDEVKVLKQSQKWENLFNY